MSKLNTHADLFLGEQELNRLYKFLDDDGFRKLFLQDSIQFGLFDNSIGGNWTNFLISQGVNPGTIKNEIGNAVDSNGQIIYRPAIDNVTITDDNAWKWIKITHLYSPDELGTVSIDQNGNLTGVGTEFLKILRGVPNNPVKIKFTNASINTQEYEVFEVINDTLATIAGDFLTESNLKLAVVGAFTPDVPVPTGSKFPFQYDSCLMTLVAETTLNTPPAFTSGLEFYVARVKRNGSNLVIQDKRSGYVYKSKSNYALLDIASTANPLFGVEQVRYDHPSSPRVQNIVDISWSFRSNNWTIDTNTNKITLNAGSGGKYKSTANFTDGDFNGWRVYAKDGSYSLVKSSFKSGGQINLILSNLDPDKFVDTTYTVNVTPNAEGIEVLCIDLPGTNGLSQRVFNFAINNIYGLQSIGLPVLGTTQQYSISYRYKTINVNSGYFAMPADVASGYLNEADFNDAGTQIGSTRTTYASNIITLVQNSGAYKNIIDTLSTGQLGGVEYFALNNANPVRDIVVGERREHLIITQEVGAELDASDGDFNQGGVPYPLTTDHYLNFPTTLPVSGLKNGNFFKLQFRGDYTQGVYNIHLVQDYVNPGNTGINLRTFSTQDFYEAGIDNLTFYVYWDGSRWTVVSERYLRVDSILNQYIKDGEISLSKLAANSVDENKLTSSVAGNGLGGGAGTPLSVNTDNSTLEVASDVVRIKDAGVSTSKIADNSVTPAKFSTPVVQCADNLQMYTRRYDIGAWNMDTTQSISVATTITGDKIRSVFAVIRNDATSSDTSLSLVNASTGVAQGCVAGWSTGANTSITLARTDGGTFDGANFTSLANRGWMIVVYEA